MKINVKSISILLNILFLCGGLYLIYFFKDKIIKKIESKKQFDVVLYGDSLIEDFEWQPKNREIKLTNIGYGGITTSELVWYIKDNVILKKPKICFLEGGINDLTNGIPIERTISNYSDMVDTLLHYDVKPVIMGTVLTRGYSKFITDLTPTNQFIDTLDLLLEKLANEKKGCEFLNINKSMSKNNNLISTYTDDGIHLNKEGYKAWSGIIEAYLLENDYK
ncbi:MAG: hypothetical protein IPN93_13705 [Bacteroidetes bacterium]|nr:hypothetical protein [Bacteroidota bacterium]